MTNKTNQEKLFFTHGGYRNLESFKSATLVYDFTIEFCKRYIDRTYGTNRTHDQMVQAARSGRQNIAEGSKASGTSKKTEIKLTNVARASLEELLLDYENYLRQNKMELWKKENPKAKAVRNLAYDKNRSNMSYESYLVNAESSANMIICLIHQTNYLLDKQLQKLSDEFLKQGGFTERLYQQRNKFRKKNF